MRCGAERCGAMSLVHVFPCCSDVLSMRVAVLTVELVALLATVLVSWKTAVTDSKIPRVMTRHAHARAFHTSGSHHRSTVLGSNADLLQEHEFRRGTIRGSPESRKSNEKLEIRTCHSEEEKTSVWMGNSFRDIRLGGKLVPIHRFPD